MRGLLKALSSGLNRAEHDVFVAPQVHAGCGDAPPTALETVWYWLNGFKVGFTECWEERHPEKIDLEAQIIRHHDRLPRCMNAPESVVPEGLTTPNNHHHGENAQ